MKIRDILTEFAPGGGSGNGPFDYGAAIIKIGEDFLDHFTDPQAGEDAAQITKAGETFIEKGMLAGVKFLYQELDTQVRDHVFDELADQGFNVEQDLIALKKRMPRDPEAGRMFAKAQADWRAQPGDTYVVTGQWGKGSSTSQDIKAISAEEAEQKFLASNKGVKFNSIDVKRRDGAAGVSEGANDGKEDNFTIDDIKRLEKIQDLETLKAQAKELIKGKPVRRMKPEKISWFYNHIDTLKNPLAVIKMMYDLMLAGEGNKVIGSRNSMSSNSYRTRFGEQGVAEG